MAAGAALVGGKTVEPIASLHTWARCVARARSVSTLGVGLTSPPQDHRKTTRADIIEGEPQVRLLYVDSSALVKRYVEDEESPAVLARIEQARVVGTALITRVEVPAALKKAVRTGDMDPNEGRGGPAGVPGGLARRHENQDERWARSTSSGLGLGP